MNALVPWIWVAGGLNLAIAAANLAIPSVLQYRAKLAHVPPIIRQVFTAHSGYIVLSLLAFGGLCLLFPHDLAAGSGLGAFLSGYMAVFWLARLAIQLFYLDRDIRRQHPGAHLAFALVAAYLAAVSMVAATGVVK